MKIFSTTSLLFVALSSFAQITVTNATFPQPNDELVTQSALTLNNISITPEGAEHQYWNFAGNDMAPMQTLTIMDAANGSIPDTFPTADILLDYFGGEGYAEVNEDEVLLIGVAGDFLQMGTPFIMPLNNPYVVRKAPLTYGETNTYSGDLDLTINPVDYPQINDLLATLGLPFEIDSIRLGMALTRQDEVDAFGTLRIHSGEYEVLRQREFTIMDIQIDILTPFGFWVDATPFLPKGIPFLEGDTTLNYNFYSATEKEEIASLTMTNDGEQVSGATFKGGPTVHEGPTSTERPVLTTNNFNVYPNPATEFIRFNAPELPSGKYQLSIFSMIGKEVFSGKYSAESLRYSQINVSELGTGSYIYRLSDGNGNQLYSQRLSVYRP